MICLALTKTFVDEERDDTVVPRPRLSLESIHNFLEFAHKVFLPLSCETARVMHIDLHHQCFIKKRCHYVHMVDLPIHGRSYCENAFHDNKFGYRGKGLVEIYSGHLKYIFATNHSLCLTILPDISFSVWNNYLHPILLWSFRRLVNSHISLAMSES